MSSASQLLMGRPLHEAVAGVRTPEEGSCEAGLEPGWRHGWPVGDRCLAEQRYTEGDEHIGGRWEEAGLLGWQEGSQLLVLPLS